MGTKAEMPGDASDTLSEAEFQDRLRELPPSAKLVAKVLETDGALPQGALTEETLLPERTVRYAVNRLENQGLVESRHSVADPRRRVYSLTR